MGLFPGFPFTEHKGGLEAETCSHLLYSGTSPPLMVPKTHVLLDISSHCGFLQSPETSKPSPTPTFLRALTVPEIQLPVCFLIQNEGLRVWGRCSGEAGRLRKQLPRSCVGKSPMSLSLISPSGEWGDLTRTGGC